MIVPPDEVRSMLIKCLLWYVLYDVDVRLPLTSTLNGHQASISKRTDVLDDG